MQGTVGAARDRAEVLRYLPFLTISEVCDGHAATAGDREALADGTSTYTWAEVKAITDAMAMGLLERGIQRDDKVLIQMPSNARLFLVRLACEKAGVKAVMASAAFRATELRSLVAQTRPCAVFVQHRFRKTDYVQLWAGLVPESGCIRHVFAFDAPGARDWLQPAEKLGETEASGADTYLPRTRFNLFERTYMITSSGSTGLPKCIDSVAYGRILTGMNQARRYGIGTGETMAALTPIISGTSESLVYSAGPYLQSKLVLLDHFSVDEMCAALSKHQVTVAVVVPTMLSRLLDQRPDPRWFATVRCVATHGAVLAPDLARQVEEMYGFRIVQAYGTADFGGIAATSIDDPLEQRVGSVGLPLDGDEVQVRRADGTPAAPGEVGSVWVRGLHETAEYYRQFDLTRETWHGGWYSVGDLGYLDAAGRLTLTGRNKDLIIRGGQNIIPAEIEALVARHPAVAETAVVGYPDREMGERVCACVVLKPGQRLDLAALTAFLRGQDIAVFKLPERLEVFAELPKNLTGMKVDKRALTATVATRTN